MRGGWECGQLGQWPQCGVWPEGAWLIGTVATVWYEATGTAANYECDSKGVWHIRVLTAYSLPSCYVGILIVPYMFRGSNFYFLILWLFSVFSQCLCIE